MNHSLIFYRSDVNRKKSRVARLWRTPLAGVYPSPAPASWLIDYLNQKVWLIQLLNSLLALIPFTVQMKHCLENLLLLPAVQYCPDTVCTSAHCPKCLKFISLYKLFTSTFKASFTSIAAGKLKVKYFVQNFFQPWPSLCIISGYLLDFLLKSLTLSQKNWSFWTFDWQYKCVIRVSINNFNKSLSTCK